MRSLTLATVLLLLSVSPQNAHARKIWATLPYRLSGPRTVLGAGSDTLGARIVEYFTISDPK